MYLVKSQRNIIPMQKMMTFDVLENLSHPLEQKSPSAWTFLTFSRYSIGKALAFWGSAKEETYFIIIFPYSIYSWQTFPFWFITIYSHTHTHTIFHSPHILLSQQLNWQHLASLLSTARALYLQSFSNCSHITIFNVGLFKFPNFLFHAILGKN